MWITLRGAGVECFQEEGHCTAVGVLGFATFGQWTNKRSTIPKWCLEPSIHSNDVHLVEKQKAPEANPRVWKLDVLSLLFPHGRSQHGLDHWRSFLKHLGVSCHAAIRGFNGQVM